MSNDPQQDDVYELEAQLKAHYANDDTDSQEPDWLRDLDEDEIIEKSGADKLQDSRKTMRDARIALAAAALIVIALCALVVTYAPPANMVGGATTDVTSSDTSDEGTAHTPEVSRGAYLEQHFRWPSTLDPAKGNSMVEFRLASLLYETLYTYDPLSYEVVPLLADGMPEVSNEGKLWKIKLKSNVHFQKHPEFSRKEAWGMQPVDADDVVDSILRLAKDLNSQSWWLIAGRIEDIDAYREGVHYDHKARQPGFDGPDAQFPMPRIHALDEQTLEIHLTRPQHDFIHVLCHPVLSIVPSQVNFDESIDINWTPAGTGPYMIDRVIENERITLRRNPEYRKRVYETDELGRRMLPLANEVHFVAKPLRSGEYTRWPGPADMTDKNSVLNRSGSITALAFQVDRVPFPVRRKLVQAVNTFTSTRPLDQHDRGEASLHGWQPAASFPNQLGQIPPSLIGMTREVSGHSRVHQEQNKTGDVADVIFEDDGKVVYEEHSLDDFYLDDDGRLIERATGKQASLEILLPSERDADREDLWRWLEEESGVSLNIVVADHFADVWKRMIDGEFECALMKQVMDGPTPLGWYAEFLSGSEERGQTNTGFKNQEYDERYEWLARKMIEEPGYLCRVDIPKQPREVLYDLGRLLSENAVVAPLRTATSVYNFRKDMRSILTPFHQKDFIEYLDDPSGVITLPMR